MDETSNIPRLLPFKPPASGASSAVTPKPSVERPATNETWEDGWQRVLMKVHVVAKHQPDAALLLAQAVEQMLDRLIDWHRGQK